jgi:signal transduction histidine kinase
MTKPLRDAWAAREPALTFAEFYDAALKTPELAVYVIRVEEDGEFSFEDANDFVSVVAGKALSEIRGRTVQEVLPVQIADCLMTHLRTAVETGDPIAYERRLELPTGNVSLKTSLIPIQRGSRGTKYVIGLTRDMTQEANLIEDAQHHAALLKTLGIALPSAVYVLDLENYSLNFIGGEATATQLEWRKGAEVPGPESGKKFFHPEDWPRAQAHWQELAALKDGEVCTISYRLLASEQEYTRHVHREIVLERDAAGKVKLVLGVSEDVSDHDKVEQEARDLSAQMLTLQIDERRRIAQELHDSTVQQLTAASLALDHARAIQSGKRGAASAPLAAINEAAQCVAEAQREIRVLSYLLHPPHIRSQGLAEALKTFAMGFGRRAGLRIELALASAAETIEDDAAVHLFRVCQEALTNVYRHADARVVKVKLEVDSVIRLTVKDDGVGINSSEDEILGLGLPGMRERMTRLGGTLKISSDPSGTVLLATIPLAHTTARVTPAT